MSRRASKFSSRITGNGFAAWKVSDRASEMALAGADIIMLTVGYLDLDTAPEITEAAVESLRAGPTHYPRLGGETQLRDVLAEVYSMQLDRVISAPEVVIFPGAQNALFNVMLALAGDGDEVIAIESGTRP